MASNVNTTIELVEDHYLITAEVQSGGTLPKEIFLYENSGTEILGEFYGTCSLEELSRLQIFTGAALQSFGNRFVRYGTAKIKVLLKDDPAAVVTALLNNIKLLSTSLSTKTTISSTHLIP